LDNLKEVSIPQSRNRLEDGGGKNDKMPRRMWKTMEAKAGKVRMEKIEGERRKERSRKETRGERKEKKAEEREDSRG